MAFLLFYLRFATRVFRTLVYFTMALNTLFTVTIWLIYCLQCIPLDTFFHKAAHSTVKCLDNSILAFVPAAFVSTLSPSLGLLHLSDGGTEHLYRHLYRHSTDPTTLGHSSQPTQTPRVNQHREPWRSRGFDFHTPLNCPP